MHRRNDVTSCESFLFLLLVSLTRVGHSNSRSKKPDQPNVDSQPFKENYSFRSFEASMDLRMYMCSSAYMRTFPSQSSTRDCLSHTRFWLEDLQGIENLSLTQLTETCLNNSLIQRI
jgi:hypothetical protein